MTAQHNFRSLAELADTIALSFKEERTHTNLANRARAQAEKNDADARRHAGIARQARIDAGRLLIEARERLTAEKTEIGWEEWCRSNVKRSEGDIRAVMRLAGAPDPEAAQQQEREATRRRVAEHRLRMTGVTEVVTPPVARPDPEIWAAVLPKGEPAITGVDPLATATSVERGRWPDLATARRAFAADFFARCCPALVRFVNDAEQMHSALGFPSSAAFVRDGLGLSPEEVSLVELLRDLAEKRR